MPRLLLLCLLLVSAWARGAEPIVPEPLEPWRDWVLEKHPRHGCPLTWSGAANPVCAWPGRLTLTVDERGARFAQRWQVYREDWIALPGNAGLWPQSVRVNGEPRALVEREGRPSLRVGAGTVEVAGELHWERMPQTLPLPPTSALVDLVLRGERQARTAYAGEGELLLAPAAVAGKQPEADRVTARVFARLEDGVPLVLESRLALHVSGSERELLLGRWLPAGAELVALESELPARIENDGRLRVQARAGDWELVLQARFTGDAREFRAERLDPAWPAEEIWSFEAAPELRGVKLTGATAVDPARVEVPSEWSELPAYLLAADSVLRLEESYRGDTRPRADELRVERELWLDFDGGGFTARDRVGGTLYQGFRLVTDPQVALGRASSHGEAQLVTRLPGETGDGIEVRERALDLETVSRLPRAARLSATGWNADVEQLGMRLNLPPGWRLWHASGVDSVSSSWVSRWDLWDIFLLLITVVLTLRVFDPRAAVLALAVFALGYHEAGGLLWLWLGVLLTLLLRRLPLPGRGGFLLRVLHGGTLVLLVIALLAHAVQLVRESLYPQLEQQRAINSASYAVDATLAAADAAGAMMPEEMAAKSMPAPAPPMSEAYIARERSEEIVVTAQRRSQSIFDSTAITQTGPGEPAWSWRQVQLSWSGPVTAGQELGLVVSGPILTRAINLLQLALWAGLLAFLANRVPRWPRAGAVPVLLAAAFVLGAAPGAARAADFPRQELLDELEQRLLRAPECAPQCASIAAAQLLVDGDTLRLRLRIDAQAAVYVPLPGERGGWEPRQVLMNGIESNALARAQGGRLNLALAPGRHEVELLGAASADRIDLVFDMPVHGLVVESTGWQVSGMRDGQVPGGVLQLARVERRVAAERTLAPNDIAAFVRVERTLLFGTEWAVNTRVERIAPADGAIHVDVRLLPGEAVTESPFRSENGLMRVVLAPGEQEASWQARLGAQPELRLEAAQQAGWVERWELRAGPQWHLRWDGLAPVKGEGIVFLPWPGETLTLTPLQPAAVDGPAQTVESLLLRSAPGQRAAEHTLGLQVRASQAGEYRLRLPEGATVLSLQADGEILDTEDTRDVVLPVRPGLQQLEVSWREAGGIGARWRTPALELGTPAANLEWQLTLPEDRWLLWLGGPAIGPAMLFWGVLAVIVAVALLLGRVRRHWPDAPPLSTAHWLLLGIGMSTAMQAGSVIVVAWLFALAARARYAGNWSRRVFNAAQAGLLLLTLVALLVLLGTIPASLLSAPDMQVQGNESWQGMLRWYQDRSAATIDRASVISLPLWVYRLAMLAWSLWLAWKLVDWLRWGWDCIGRDGFWRRAPAAVPAPAAATVDENASKPLPEETDG